MAVAADLESTFLQHLPVVERATSAVARRYGFTPDDIADLTSWVKLKLIEDDYATLRKFRGESSISTYLTVVVAMLVRDYRVQRWGRWRPSATARRLGDVAIRLETLVRRNGYPLQQAGELLRTAGLTTQSDRDLAALLASLPARQPLRPVEVGAESLETVTDAGSADAPLAFRENDAHRESLRRRVEDAIGTLPDDDRLILRLRFWENLSIADIARGLRIEQKPLYRRLDRLLAGLRQALAASGVEAGMLQEILDEPVS